MIITINDSCWVSVSAGISVVYSHSDGNRSPLTCQERSPRVSDQPQSTVLVSLVSVEYYNMSVTNNHNQQ